MNSFTTWLQCLWDVVICKWYQWGNCSLKPLGEKKKAVWILSSVYNCLKQENSNWVSSRAPWTVAYLKREGFESKAKLLITNRMSVVTVPGTSFRNLVEITFTRQEKITHVRLGFFQSHSQNRLVLRGKAWLAGKSFEPHVWHLFSKTTPTCSLGRFCYCEWRRAWQQPLTFNSALEF